MGFNIAQKSGRQTQSRDRSSAPSVLRRQSVFLTPLLALCLCNPVSRCYVIFQEIAGFIVLFSDFCKTALVQRQKALNE